MLSFPGVADAINFASASVYIITTKQRRFCELLLRRNGVNLPSERIFPHGSGSKVSTLKKLLAEEKEADAIVFVEDRYQTLETASLTLLGTRVQLFLADWGYNTPASRAECTDHPLIALLDLHAFVTRFQ